MLDFFSEIFMIIISDLIIIKFTRNRNEVKKDES